MSTTDTSTPNTPGATPQAGPGRALRIIIVVALVAVFGPILLGHPLMSVYVAAVAALAVVAYLAYRRAYRTAGVVDGATTVGLMGAARLTGHVDAILPLFLLGVLLGVVVYVAARLREE